MALLWARPGSIEFHRGFSYINNGGYLRDNVIIGRYCSIGRRVTIGAGTHPMAGLSTSMHVAGGGTPYDQTQLTGITQSTPAKKRPTLIHCDVWLGDGVVVMPGVHIAPGSVIGANAVVTKDTEPYGIYVGMPARKISSRFSPELAERMVASQWWDIDHDKLNSLPTRNVFEFLDNLDNLASERSALETLRIANG
ncbi:CatB-related O-acetyltransferase [Citreicella sp. C3M06]|uniref:CatB-related O-acetyltransferase n=1 Tax=Citreicella sp. C3M06 TaxID=2841564 RepID=UPI001C098E7C|nr:CatB-related O-acetyltransferase [Citreicella sp. C3M06]MBU2963482.1 CatB-related O-acetyltransferase [Citreicella sp. C3M06]